MKRFPRWQLALALGFLLIYTLVALIGRQGFALTAFSDISGTTLWLIATIVMVWAARNNHGRARWFWSLLAASAVMVGTNLGAWLYYEVFAGRPTPDPFWADIPIFLQPVPMMAAAAMRPGSRQRAQKFQLSTLNFLILLLWWVCVYMFLVYPNEYILPNKIIFNGYYYSLYVLEFSVLLAVLGSMALVAEGSWRRIYWHLFFASSLYLIAYQWLNAALEREEYYSGSIYDVPNYAAICWFILIAVRARNVPSEPLIEGGREQSADLPGYLAALAVLSLPVMGLCELFLDPHGNKLLLFRLAVILAGILFMGLLVFLRQTLMNRERSRLLLESEQNLEQLQSAQNQLLQRERLAGVGQLVAGVAHELNNPLTAVIGYSDLLLEQHANSPSRPKLERLGAEARRIKRILDNLISFARPQTEGRRLMDIAAVASESLMLCEHQLQTSGIDVQMNFAQNLPRLSLNEGQFKRVFVNLFNNSASALKESPEKKIVVEGNLVDQKVVVRFSDSGKGFTDVTRAFDPFYTTRPVGQGTGLGLSICYGAVKEHSGNIFAQNLQPNGAAVIIELPVA
jgi:signal transduction histidine kinase